MKFIVSWFDEAEQYFESRPYNTREDADRMAETTQGHGVTIWDTDGPDGGDILT